MKISLFAALTALAVSVLAEPLPVVSNVKIAQEGTVAVITYSIDRAPAIVTLSLSVDGVVDDELASAASGDVFKVVETAGSHTINLRVRKTKLRDQVVPNVKATVTAWPLSRPPDYMVVDLAENSSERVRYYASTNTLPGGLFANKAYRTTKLVMRLIRAKGVEWEMGGGGEMAVKAGLQAGTADAFLLSERIHPVELDADYWIGVFEITQGQFQAFTGDWPSKVVFKLDREMRPVEAYSFSQLRHVNSTGADSLAYYPNPPGDWSVLGKLRDRTGIAFDLPSEAMWEFACRSGEGMGRFNTGLPFVRDEGDWGWTPEFRASFPGRIYCTQQNPTSSSAEAAKDGPASGTAIVGSYAPNHWGLYDMHGNVGEFCLDFYADDITALNGAVNANETKLVSDPSADGGNRVARGGYWSTHSIYARSARREQKGETSESSNHGFRVVCPLETAENHL